RLHSIKTRGVLRSFPTLAFACLLLVGCSVARNGISRSPSGTKLSSDASDQPFALRREPIGNLNHYNLSLELYRDPATGHVEKVSLLQRPEHSSLVTDFTDDGIGELRD